MSAFSLRLKTADWERAVRLLGDKAPIPGARALNRSGMRARTVLTRDVAMDIGVRVGIVRQSISLDEATPRRLVVRIIALGKPIPLIDLGARGPEPSRGRGRGVTAKMQGKRKRYPHAFIARMPGSGHRGVFQRTSGKFMKSRPKRQAIHELHGPSVPLVFDKHALRASAAFGVALSGNLEHEVGFLLRSVSRTG